MYYLVEIRECDRSAHLGSSCRFYKHRSLKKLAEQRAVGLDPWTLYKVYEGVYRNLESDTVKYDKTMFSGDHSDVSRYLMLDYAVDHGKLKTVDPEEWDRLIRAEYDRKFNHRPKNSLI